VPHQLGAAPDRVFATITPGGASAGGGGGDEGANGARRGRMAVI
jgi:hypothetical protein